MNMDVPERVLYWKPITEHVLVTETLNKAGYMLHKSPGQYKVKNRKYNCLANVFSQMYV